MKSLIRCILFFAGITTAQGTWVLQDSSFSSLANPFHSVFFYDANLGWAAGTNGVIVKTTDGGLTWNRLPFNPTNDPARRVRKIQFANPDTGYFIMLTAIFKSIDGGNSWTSYNTSLPTTDTLISLCVKNGTNVNIGSQQGQIFYTTSSVTWTRIDLTGTPRPVYDIYFKGMDTGIAVSDVGFMYRCTNGWNWTQMIGGTSSRLGRCTFRAIHGISARIIVVGDSLTSGVGYRPCVGITQNGAGLTPVNAGIPNLSLRSVHYASVDTVWAFGFNGMLKSVDAGASWSQVSYPTSAPLYSGYFVNPNLGFAVGTNGIILRYTDGAVPVLTVRKGKSRLSQYFTDLLGRKSLQPHSLPVLAIPLKK